MIYSVNFKETKILYKQPIKMDTKLFINICWNSGVYIEKNEDESSFNFF